MTRILVVLAPVLVSCYCLSSPHPTSRNSICRETKAPTGTWDEQRHSDGCARKDGMAAGGTALDFREILKKERTIARGKQRSTRTAPDADKHVRRYLHKRRRRINLDSDHRVVTRDGLDGIYYVPNFVTADEGTRLQQAARGEDGSAEDTGATPWVDLHKRRLQIHGGTPHPSGMVEEELPRFLREVCQALVESGIFPEDTPPNHVLLNEYSDGQGIGPHKDGPLYEERVAILSLGREATLYFWASLEDANSASSSAQDEKANGAEEASGKDIRHKPSNSLSATSAAIASVRCEDCSLVVLTGEAYREVWHGIAASSSGSVARARLEKSHGRDVRQDDPRTRMSFTVRRVARVVPTDSVIENAAAWSEMNRRRRGFERSVTETSVVASAPS